MRNRLFTCCRCGLTGLGLGLLLPLTALAHNIHFPEAAALIPAQLLSLAEAKEHFDRGAIFIDIRSTAEWEAERIATATHLSWDNHQITRAKLAELAPAMDTLIIIYANNAQEDDLRQVMYMLTAKWGYTNVRVLVGGFSDWVKHNYPVE